MKKNDLKKIIAKKKKEVKNKKLILKNEKTK